MTWESFASVEEAKESGREMLAALIPFDIWLGMRPRTDGDVDAYHVLADILRSLAKYGDPFRRRDYRGNPVPMVMTESTWADERQFFHIDDDGMLAPYPKNS
jgi:hypothetical protein